MLNGGEKPGIRLRYPHMLPEDWAVWVSFLKSGCVDVLEVWYDVHVGRPVEVPVGSPEYLKRVSDGVTRKRIDVVARLEGELWVIELKPVCGGQALGQVLVYRDLFVREHGGSLTISPVVICNQLEYDAQRSAIALGVHVVALQGVLS